MRGIGGGQGQGHKCDHKQDKNKNKSRGRAIDRPAAEGEGVMVVGKANPWSPRSYVCLAWPYMNPSLTTAALCTLCWLPDLSWYLICCCSCCCMRMIGNSQQRVREIGRTWRWYNLATDYLNLQSCVRIKNRCWWTKCPLHSVFHEYDDAGLDNMHIGLTRQGRNVSTPSHISPHRTAPLDLTDSLTHSLSVFDCCSMSSLARFVRGVWWGI